MGRAGDRVRRAPTATAPRRRRCAPPPGLADRTLRVGARGEDKRQEQRDDAGRGGPHGDRGGKGQVRPQSIFL